MATVLIALRDLLIGLALAWVGISLDHHAPKAQDTAPACETGSAVCDVLENAKR